MLVRRTRGGAGKKGPEPEHRKPWSIEEVTNARGDRVVTEFVAALEGINADEAKALLAALAERGNGLGLPESKSLGQGLCELRGSEVRIFYCFRPGRRIVLLGAMLKKRADIPREVIEQLRKLVKRIA